MKRYLFTIASLVILNVDFACAQSNIDEMDKEITKAIELQHLDKTFEETMKTTVNQLIQQGTLKESDLDALSKEMTTMVMPYLSKKIKDLYCQYYTLDEIKKLNEYLGSDLGQKTLRLTPLFTKVGMEVTSLPEVQEKMITIFNKYLK